jgi:hypothetical protein
MIGRSGRLPLEESPAGGPANAHFNLAQRLLAGCGRVDEEATQASHCASSIV